MRARRLHVHGTACRRQVVRAVVGPGWMGMALAASPTAQAQENLPLEAPRPGTRPRSALAPTSPKGRGPTAAGTDVLLGYVFIVPGGSEYLTRGCTQVVACAGVACFFWELLRSFGRCRTVPGAVRRMRLLVTILQKEERRWVS